MKNRHQFRIAHVSEWAGAFAGQSTIALINGATIVSRHATMADAQAAYRSALKAVR
jgi:hypothetical protein